MTFEEIARKYSNFYSPNCKVLVDGNDLVADHRAELVRVSVKSAIKGADEFSFTVNDLGAKLLDAGTFDPGKEVEVKLGYGSTLSTAMVGEIIALRANFPADGKPSLVIRGYDLSYQFTRTRAAKNWKDKADDEVVTEIVKNAKHIEDKVIDSTGTVHPKLHQGDAMDYDFIASLARANDFEFLVRGKTLYFRKPATDESPVLSLKYGESLLSFAPELNTASQVSEVVVQGWDAKAKEPITGRSPQGSPPSPSGGGKSAAQMTADLHGTVTEVISNRPVYSQQEADSLAKSVLDKRQSGLVTGTAEIVGIPEIAAGDNVELLGLGTRFSRSYYVEKASHSFDGSGYRATLTVREQAIGS